MATVAVSRRTLAFRFGPGRAIALTLAVALMIGVGLVGGSLAVYWLFGITFGVILQRSRLCFASAFRDLFLMRDGGNMRGVLAGLAVASVGFTLIEVHAVPIPSFGVVPDEAHLMPLSLQFIAGGLMVALLGILAGLGLATQHWNWWWATFSAHAPTIWLPNYFGYGGTVLLTLGVLAVICLATLWWEMRAGPRPSFSPRRPAEAPASTVAGWLLQAISEHLR